MAEGQTMDQAEGSVGFRASHWSQGKQGVSDSESCILKHAVKIHVTYLVTVKRPIDWPTNHLFYHKNSELCYRLLIIIT